MRVLGWNIAFCITSKDRCFYINFTPLVVLLSLTWTVIVLNHWSKNFIAVQIRQKNSGICSTRITWFARWTWCCDLTSLQLRWIDDFDWFVFWLWNKCLVFKCRHSRIVEEQLTGVHLRSQPQPYVTKVNVYQPPPPPASNGGGPPGVNRPNMLFRSGHYINSILSASTLKDCL